MPIYQFFCYKCFTPHEITMTLKDHERVQKWRKRFIPCPTKNSDGTECGGKLKELICPPKTIIIN